MISYRPSSLPLDFIYLPESVLRSSQRASAEIGEVLLGTSDLIASTYRLTYKNRKRFTGAASVSQHILRCIGCKHLLHSSSTQY
jgi:hypothetical protein